MTTKQNNPPNDGEYPVNVTFEDDLLRVMLRDGREIATPMAWYPRLQNASTEQRNRYELSISGVYWPDLDEDLSVAGMLRGVRSPTNNNIESA